MPEISALSGRPVPYPWGDWGFTSTLSRLGWERPERKVRERNSDEDLYLLDWARDVEKVPQEPLITFRRVRIRGDLSSTACLGPQSPLQMPGSEEGTVGAAHEMSRQMELKEGYRATGGPPKGHPKPCSMALKCQRCVIRSQWAWACPIVWQGDFNSNVFKFISGWHHRGMTLPESQCQQKPAGTNIEILMLNGSPRLLYLIPVDTEVTAKTYSGPWAH